MGHTVLILGLHKGKAEYRKVCGQKLRGPEDTFYRGEVIPELPCPGPHHCLTLAPGGQDIQHFLQTQLHVKNS